MPFTFAHPAIVVPLRRHAPLSALIIGSMVPDLGHLIALPLPRPFTHSLPGLPLFCLPAGLLLWLLFQVVLRQPLIALGPAGLSARLPSAWPVPRTLTRLWPILLGLALGAISHLLWDRLTTIEWRVEWTRPLLIPLFPVFGHPLTGYELLRHGSAVIGLGLMAFWLRRWWRQTPPQGSHAGSSSLPQRARWLIIGVGLLAVLAFSLLAADSTWLDFSGRNRMGRSVRAALPALSTVLLLYAGLWHGWQRRSGGRS